MHIADYASISQSGTLSIVGIFNAMNTPSVPFIQPKIVAVIGLFVDEGDENETSTLTAILRDPEGRVLRENAMDLQIQNRDPLNPKINLIIDFPLLTLNEIGFHELEIWIDNEQQEQIGFDLRKI